MQTLPNASSRNFFKWQKVGQSVDIVVTQAPVFDKPNSFGGTDSFLLGQDAEGNVQQVPLTFNPREKIRVIADRVIPLKTRFILTFTGTTPIKGKAPLKNFDVQVDGLGEEGDASFP
jgi:hypothetical protein